ncbi:MAG TPA: anhydro-N-acetylmuramic acid kinase [Thermoanaerobaculia bacterium]|nr:anhydro-N-acetylmuramic acid kinase [Thermoanaerobaculia bacterium]
MSRLQRLMRVAGKRRRLVVGLMSGTSVDGIDAALVEIEGGGEDARVHLVAFRSFPFPDSLRQRIFHLFDPATARIEELCKLDFLVGELFAEAAKRLLAENGFAPEDVDVIGTAGQTVWHAPEPVVAELAVDWAGELLMTRSTLAIGQSAVIAERTGALTLGDLRVRDVAAGGHGAPLIAYADWVLLRHPTLGRCVQNIGGIGNVTYLPPGAARQDVVAFDTGPGNMVIDALAEALSAGEMKFDRDGAMAARGQVREALLAELREHPFFAREPPKTTGREVFGVQFARELLARAGDAAPEDLVATATALTASTIAEAYERFLAPRGPIDEVIVGGGGAKNPTLMRMLRERLPSDAIIVRHEERGIDSRAKEALGIAVIANDSLLGLETNVTGATGGRGTVLGKLNL